MVPSGSGGFRDLGVVCGMVGGAVFNDVAAFAENILGVVRLKGNGGC